MGLWSTKSIATLQADPTIDGDIPAFKRVLGAADLTAIGIGAIIGAGVFVVTGTAAAQYAGPAVALSFVVAGLGCLFVALCYAELASMIPAAGSAYTYAYAAFGELIAWIIGWNLLLEYFVGVVTVAVAWSAYSVAFLKDLGVSLPAALTQAPVAVEWAGHVRRVPGGVVNLPAAALVLIMTMVLSTGARRSATFNNIIVIAKVTLVLIVIGFGFMYVRAGNWHPFVPPSGGTFGRFGWSGILAGAGVVFFAFVGFDTVSTAAQEARTPQRGLPIAILGSLAICTALYILMALVMTGLVRYPDLNAPHPMLVAVAGAGPALHWLAYVVTVAGILGLASVALVVLMGLTRILYAVSRDGLVPPVFGTVRPRFGMPQVPTILIGVCVAVVAGVFPIGLMLDLPNVGTLIAFIGVCGSILMLRYRAPNVRRPFRAPWVPVVPILGIAFSLGVMATFPTENWIRFAVWMLIGLVIYFVYGVKNVATRVH